MNEADSQTLASEYPFESRYITIDHSLEAGRRSSKIHYIDEGVGEQTLLFIHGNPTWSYYFRHVIKALKNDFRCIAIDHLGCGLSEKPASGTFLLKDRIDLLKSFVSSLGLERFSLVMHDWGGPIGMGLATQMPERIDKLIVTNTIAFRSDWIAWQINMCRQPVIGKILNYYANGFLRAAMQMTTVKPLKANTKRGYLMPHRKPSDRLSIHEFVKDIPMSSKHRSYDSILDIESKLSLFRDDQVSILWGMKDFCFAPRFLKNWEAIYPNSPQHSFEKAGHFLFEDAPDECSTIIRNFVRA